MHKRPLITTNHTHMVCAWKARQTRMHCFGSVLCKVGDAEILSRVQLEMEEAKDVLHDHMHPPSNLFSYTPLLGSSFQVGRSSAGTVYVV